MKLCLQKSIHKYQQNLPTPVLSVSGTRVRYNPSQPKAAQRYLFGTPDFLCKMLGSIFSTRILYHRMSYLSSKILILSTKISTCSTFIYSVTVIRQTLGYMKGVISMIIISLILAAFSRLLSPILGISTGQNFPPTLSAEEERLNFALFKKGDEEARQKLILHNLRLVSHIVRKYYSTSKNQEDLVSIGTIGLIKAVDTYNTDNGTRFATYASKCIQNEILMSFRSQKKHSSEVSIHETIDVDRDGNPLAYIDVISSDENVPLEIERKIMTDKAMKCIKTVLSLRERQIIIMRYGLCGTEELTQREIAERLGISRSYVSRIEKSALEKLKSAIDG